MGIFTIECKKCGSSYTAFSGDMSQMQGICHTCRSPEPTKQCTQQGRTMMNPHLELIRRHIAHPDTVSAEQLKANAKDAYAIAAFASACASYPTDSEAVKYWIRVFDRGEEL